MQNDLLQGGSLESLNEALVSDHNVLVLLSSNG